MVPASAQPKVAVSLAPLDVTWSSDSIDTTRDQARATQSQRQSLPAALKEAQDTFIKDTDVISAKFR
jgi:hypothetical protein